MKYLIFLLLLPVIVQANESADEKLEKELVSRCKATFKIIKDNDLQAFIALMPLQPGVEEKKYIKDILHEKHKKWIVNGGGIKEIKALGVSYSVPDKEKITAFNALSEAQIKLQVKTEKKTEKTMCKFIRDNRAWYLSRLP